MKTLCTAQAEGYAMPLDTPERISRFLPQMPRAKHSAINAGHAALQPHVAMFSMVMIDEASPASWTLQLCY